MTRTKDKFFRPEDFKVAEYCARMYDIAPYDLDNFHLAVNEETARQTNAILKAEIEKSVKVYGRIGTYASSWSTYPPGTFIQENNTHKAVLLFIEELKHDKSEGEE